MLSMYGIEWNCHHRNWNWSRIAFIRIGIGVELPLSELELELNCLLDWVPDSELEWNCLYRNWNWNWIAKTELTPALLGAGDTGHWWHCTGDTGHWWHYTALQHDYLTTWQNTPQLPTHLSCSLRGDIPVSCVRSALCTWWSAVARRCPRRWPPWWRERTRCGPSAPRGSASAPRPAGSTDNTPVRQRSQWSQGTDMASASAIALSRQRYFGKR